MRRHGNILLLVAFSMTALMGAAAMAVDISWVIASKAQLRVATDSCALATASYIMNRSAEMAPEELAQAAIAYGQEFMKQNEVASMLLDAEYVEVGQAVWDDGKIIGFVPNTSSFNAVRVAVSMTGSQKLPAILGSLLGHDYYEPQARAIALVDDRFADYRPESPGGALLPFTISVDYHAQQLASGLDSWSFNGSSQQPVGLADGDNEVWLFPTDNNENGGGGNGPNSDSLTDGGGNFGTLNIGIGNQGTSELSAQVINGVSGTELAAEIGTDHISFIDADGNQLDYTMTGNPGISGGLSAALDQRIGDVVGYFIHDGLTENGQNAQYNIVGIRFGRLMEVHLEGNPNEKRLVIQPTPHAGPGITSNSNAPSSGGLVWELRLGA